MNLTIKNDLGLFGCRVAAIIYNHEKDAILLQKQEKNEKYMLPGGRISQNESSYDSIKRELQEELGLDEEPNLRYISENLIQFSKGKYHEIGFYYVVILDEEKYEIFSHDKIYSLDKSENPSEFVWIKIIDLAKYDLMPNNIKELVASNDVLGHDKIKHLVYREF